MTRPGPSQLSNIILSQTPLDARPRQLVSVIEEIVLEQEWETSRTMARERAESWTAATLSIIQREISHCTELGRPTAVALNSSSPYMIQGACFEEPGDSDELRSAKRRRLTSRDYSSLFACLDPWQFEALCGKLLSLIGVENPTITPRSGDEGIDFYGRLSLESVLFPQLALPSVAAQLGIWLVGQAKHYSGTQVGTPEIRDLFGAIALGRFGAFGGRGTGFEALTIRVGDPVFALFVTTGTISSNAWRLLKRSGVIGMDGQMVAAFLADQSVSPDSLRLD